MAAVLSEPHENGKHISIIPQDCPFSYISAKMHTKSYKTVFIITFDMNG